MIDLTKIEQFKDSLAGIETVKCGLHMFGCIMIFIVTASQLACFF